MTAQAKSKRTLIVLILLAVATGALGQVAVSKVEPPNWWAGLPENPMVLLYGSDLAGARVTTNYPGVTVDRVEPANEGYLFVWLKMAPNVMVGTAKFTVTGKTGSAGFEFPILTRRCGESPTPLKPTAGLNGAPGLSDCHVGLRKNDVMYLIMPDRFANGDTTNDDPPGAKGFYDRQKARGFHGGDLKGVTQHLPYLKDLGVTALWLTPFWKNANDYHGYGVTDMYAVDPHFGTMRDYQDFVAASHTQGIKFFFDYVVNHTGPDHVWAQHPPLATWLHGTPEKHPPFDYHFEYLVDPHAPPQEWENITEGWFADRLPDLNVDDPHVAKYLLDNSVWWMEMGGVDGLRLDTFPYSSRKFWSYWHGELFRIYPQTNTIGEVYNFDPSITSFFEGGKKSWDGIDDKLSTMFDFPMQSAIREVLLRAKPADSLQKTMRYDSLYLRPDGLVTFIGNHDQKRFMGESGATPEKLKAAFGLLMTLRGIPQLYSGDEIAMTGGDDPDNRHDFPGGWTGDAQNAFTQQGRTPEQQQVFAYLQSMIALRKEHAALRDGHQWTIGAAEKYFVYLRDDGKDKVLVVFNEGDQPLKLQLRDTPLAPVKVLEPLMGASEANIADGMLTVERPGYGVSVYLVR
jgi:glycosidase